MRFLVESDLMDYDPSLLWITYFSKLPAPHRKRSDKYILFIFTLNKYKLITNTHTYTHTHTHIYIYMVAYANTVFLKIF